MIRYFQIVLFIFTSLTQGFGQDWNDTCDEAIARANKDFENGIMKATSYGLIIEDDYYFEEFYDKYLKDKYGILASNGGCVINESTECYSSRMFKLIKDKFGERFFEITRKEARKLYIPKEQELIDDYPSRDSDGAYIVVDIMPKFDGGYEKFYEYVSYQLEASKVEIESIESKSFISFVIDIKGQSRNVGILRGSNAVLDSLLINILQEMPKWTPGKLNNQNVDVKLVLPFSH